jgi:hypothetical protein
VGQGAPARPVRHHGDSVGASLRLHLMNNGIVLLIQLGALLAAGHSGTG